MNYPVAEPRGIKWNFLFPTQRVGKLNHLMIKRLDTKAQFTNQRVIFRFVYHE